MKFLQIAYIKFEKKINFDRLKFVLFVHLLFLIPNVGKAIEQEFTPPSEKQLLSMAKIYFNSWNLILTKEPIVTWDSNLNLHGFFNNTNNEIKLNPNDEIGQIQLTMIHEWVHALRFSFQKNEELWLNEGLACFMEYKFSGIWPMSFQTQLKLKMKLMISNHEEDYKSGGFGYVGAFLFINYLYNHFGGDHLIYDLITSKKTGWESIHWAINKNLKELKLEVDPSILSKSSILRHFALALWFNEPYLAKYALFQIDPNFEGLGILNSQIQLNPNSENKKNPSSEDSFYSTVKRGEDSLIQIDFLTFNEFHPTALNNIKIKSIENWGLNQTPKFKIEKLDDSFKTMNTKKNNSYSPETIISIKTLK